MSRPFFAYMLRCADGSYYVGHTDDLERRLSEHRVGGRCRYTERRRPVSLVWFRAFSTREEAKKSEVRVKNWSRAKKEALMRDHYDALRRAARKRFAPRSGG